MGRWSPQKKDTLAALADEIRQHYARGRAIIGVDARRQAVSDTFATELAAALRTAGSSVFTAATTDFLLPRARRETAPLGGLDVALLRRVLIDPFRTAGSTGFVLTGFDAQRDEPVYQPKWASAGTDALLLIHGRHLHAPELAGIWNYSVWLDAPSEIPDAPGPEPADADAGAGGKTMTDYVTRHRPNEKATAIYDLADPEHPRRIFADSC